MCFKLFFYYVNCLIKSKSLTVLSIIPDGMNGGTIQAVQCRGHGEFSTFFCECSETCPEAEIFENP